MTRKVETRAFDAADYLETPEQVAAFLDAALDEGDAGVIASALGAIARARGMAAIAEETGLSREALYRSLSADGNPTLSTLVSVLRVCDLRLRVAPVD